MQNDGDQPSFRDGALTPDTESRDSGLDASHRPGMTASKRTHRKIAQPQVGVAAFFPEPEQRPVQRLPQQIIAFADGDADALAEIAALDERPARECAAFARVRSADPERQRDRVAKNEIDLAAAKRQP